MKWGFLFACVVVFILLFLSLANGQDGYYGADSKWHQHDPNWKGLWIAQDFARCCGEQDCEEANKGNVTVTRLENGNGYMVQWPGQEPEFVPYNSPNVEASKDGEYWVCHRRIYGQPMTVRCLFVPPLGF